MLLVACDSAPPHSEDLEEFVVEALGLALLAALARPLRSESGRAGTYLVPRQTHATIPVRQRQQISQPSGPVDPTTRATYPELLYARPSAGPLIALGCYQIPSFARA